MLISFQRLLQMVVSAENLKIYLLKIVPLCSNGNRKYRDDRCSVLLNAMAAFKVQLVILEPNETLDTDEINFQSLAD
jgi:hypothetical protein